MGLLLFHLFWLLWYFEFWIFLFLVLCLSFLSTHITLMILEIWNLFLYVCYFIKESTVGEVDFITMFFCCFSFLFPSLFFVLNMVVIPFQVLDLFTTKRDLFLFIFLEKYNLLNYIFHFCVCFLFLFLFCFVLCLFWFVITCRLYLLFNYTKYR